MVSFLDRDVAILNLSLGCYTEDNQPPLRCNAQSRS